MRRLILHIGNHKTGTTSIQNWLWVNKAALEARGVGLIHGIGSGNGHDFLGFSSEPIFPDGFRVLHPGPLQAAAEAAPGDTVILSSENFAFFFTQAAIDQLAALLRPLFDQITVLVYLRRQDRQAVSHHGEGARPDRAAEWELWGRSPKALPDPNPMQRLYLNYDERLGKWEKAFGAQALRVRIYDRAQLEKGDIVTDFVKEIGIDPEGCTFPPDRNPSLDRVKGRIGHIINRLTQDADAARRIMYRLRTTSDLPKPARDAARAFLKPYQDGNIALNRRLGLSPLPELFTQDFDDLPEEPQVTWTDQHFNRAVESLVTLLLQQGEAPVSAADMLAAVEALAAKQPNRAFRLAKGAVEMHPTDEALNARALELRELLAKRRKGES